MNYRVKSYAAQSSGSLLAPFQIERRSPRTDDVVIEILYCGVCHSDVHNVHNDWGNANYPMVPGHEIIGKVLAVGAGVSRFQIGDRVGVGCLVASCKHCAPCEHGQEQYCQNGATYTYNHQDPIDGSRTYGGYSETIVVAQDFVLKVPDSLDLAGAAPLLCAGITTYSPLRHWQVGQGSKVAIVGLGGLGHMGLKLAKAMGAEVTLFSRSPGKEADARRLGADHVVMSTDTAQMTAVAGKFDLIINTVPYKHDVNPYIPTLASGGTMVMVGYLGPLDDFNTGPLVFSRKALAGSLIGGIAETQEMLDFCGQHGIHSDIELIRIQDINHAFARLLKADVKYRFVIDMASLKEPA
ncbi:NAD(P)-dependent alcohol dehydrogenase [Aquitalea palustris]|uniref:NAD(P)-dependent alcohol dehydrogenase n=1 Tax=Aquitalea palustris TaxID=2480983 RepID=A0A454JHS9_9NEIS|nr:NAD(P)-dependent alcohol dehydrogenase [Aquitalea palustris]RMC96960.1 NAD(P)-dependent alcohol dehydrogenase [Aquitalea palustris]